MILFEICPRGDFEKKKSLKMAPLVVFIFELGGGGGGLVMLFKNGP